MAIISAVVLRAKALKNGKHRVRISIAHNGVTRYIVTDILLDSINEFKNGAVVRRPDAAYQNTRLRGILQEYQKIIDSTPYTNGMTCQELVQIIQNGPVTRHKYLDTVFEEYLRNAVIKPSSEGIYRGWWKAISQAMPSPIMLRNISRATVLSLEKKLWGEGRSPSTIHNFITLFKGLVNYARKCGYVEFRADPFLGYKMPRPEVRDCWLSVEDIRTIRDVPLSKRCLIKCRDMFMLSYYLGGINLIDLVKIDFNESPDTLKYIRTKTERTPKLNKFVEFEIPDEAKEIINRYKGDDGHVRFGRMHPFKAKINCTNWFKELAELTGISNIIYYSARKSFSQHAFTLGVNTGVIDYILGHSLNNTNKIIYSYIHVTPEMATEAVRKVLDNLK